MLKILWISLILNSFAETVNGPVQETKRDRALPTVFSSRPYGPRIVASPMTETAKQLNCIKGLADIEFAKDPEKNKLTHTVITSLFGALANPLHERFEAFKMKPRERALFLSQMIVESAGMGQMTETARQLPSTSTQMVNNPQMTNAYLSVTMEMQNRKAQQDKPLFPLGRGLLQTTHCDGLMASLNYLRGFYAGEEKPDWKLNWDGVYRIGQTCRQDDLETFKLAYFNKYGYDIDPYGVTGVNFATGETNMLKIGTISTQFVASEVTGAAGARNQPLPGAGQSISSTQMTIDLALAYWRGHCGKKADSIENRNDTYCTGFVKPERTREEQDVACITQCVRGNVDGWKERLRWFKLAMLAQKGCENITPADTATLGSSQ